MNSYQSIKAFMLPYTSENQKSAAVQSASLITTVAGSLLLSLPLLPLFI